MHNFSDEQVEAAAKALHETRNPWIGAYGDWGAAGYEIKQAFRESARAALVAAQGATTEELAKIKPLFENLSREYPNECNKRVKAEAERDAALAAIERVRAEADAYAEQSDVMEPCGAVAQALRTALDGAPEPEWEYGLLNPQAPDGGKLQGGAHLISANREHILAQQRRGHPAILAVRRRKAGSWEQVEGESK